MKSLPLQVIAPIGVLVASLLALSFNCAKVDTGAPGGGGRGVFGAGSGGRVVFGAGTGGFMAAACTGQCTDFPADPIMDTGVPASAPGMFSGTPPTSGGPCITEPEDDTRFPNNWLRPRVKFGDSGSLGGKVAQIRMKAPNQANDLVVYTMSDSWTMTQDIWRGLRSHQINDYVTITVWVQGGGASQTRFKTAPVGANGKLVFWAAKPSEVDKNLDTDCMKDANNQPVPSCYENDSELRGFSVGDETTISVLTIGQVAQSSQDNNNKKSKVRCIGCHTGAPGGDYVAFNDAWPWRGVMAGVTSSNVGMSPTFMTQGGLEDMLQPALGVMTFSAAHWMDGDRIVITSYSMTSVNQGDWYNAPNHNPTPSLAWFDLASPPVPLTGANVQGDPANPDRVFPILNTNMGFITRTGDSRGAATPNWSHDGMTIAYSSTDAAVDGHLDNLPTPNPNPNNEVHHMGHSDIWTVPYGNKAGGTAKPVSGADTTMYEETFPAFSADDRLIAYNRLPASEPMYANPNSEIAVIRTEGGQMGTRLKANDPPACTNLKSPGVNNHWPKWSPEVQASSDGTWYWVVFSSNRANIPPVTSKYGAKRSIKISQLYVAPVLLTESGIESFPAIYFWNQPTTTVNTTPVWDVFQIPPIGYRVNR